MVFKRIRSDMQSEIMNERMQIEIVPILISMGDLQLVFTLIDALAICHDKTSILRVF